MKATPTNPNQATTITLTQPGHYQTIISEVHPDQYIEVGENSQIQLLDNYSLVIFVRHESIEEANSYVQQQNSRGR